MFLQLTDTTGEILQTTLYTPPFQSKDSCPLIRSEDILKLIWKFTLLVASVLVFLSYSFYRTINI